MVNDLPQEIILMDDRGRITIPKRMLKTLGITIPENQKNTAVVIIASPTFNNCKFLAIKKL